MTEAHASVGVLVCGVGIAATALLPGPGHPVGERAWIEVPRHRVDLASAGTAELALVPGIGPSLARRIVAARSEVGVASVEDLGKVDGVGKATLESIRSHVRVGPAPGKGGRNGR